MPGQEELASLLGRPARSRHGGSCVRSADAVSSSALAFRAARVARWNATMPAAITSVPSAVSHQGWNPSVVIHGILAWRRTATTAIPLHITWPAIAGRIDPVLATNHASRPPTKNADTACHGFRWMKAKRKLETRIAVHWP